MKDGVVVEITDTKVVLLGIATELTLGVGGLFREGLYRLQPSPN